MKNTFSLVLLFELGENYQNYGDVSCCVIFSCPVIFLDFFCAQIFRLRDLISRAKSSDDLVQTKR